MEDNEQIEELSSAKQSRRWIFTINNPFGTEVEEVDITNTDLPIRNDYYNLSIINRLENKSLFIFKYVKVTIKTSDCTSEDIIVKRPFFKDIDSAMQYFQNLEHFKYCVFQVERGEKEDTEHIQGGITFNIAKRFQTIKIYFPTAHIEQAKGSNGQVRDYCTKEDTRISGPYELGIFAEERARTDIKDFVTMAQAGATKQQLSKLYPTLYLREMNKIDKIYADMYEEFKTKCRNIEVIYIYGCRRKGKSKYPLKLHGMNNVFSISDYDHYMFTGYNYEDVIMFDEFTGQVHPITYMNKLLEPYPLLLNIKGGKVPAVYTKVYIISNYPLREVYKSEQEDYKESYDAFCDRINKIIRFDDKGNTHLERDTIWEEVPKEEVELEGLTKRISKIINYDYYGKPSIKYNRYNQSVQEEMQLIPLTDEEAEMLDF